MKPDLIALCETRVGSIKPIENTFREYRVIGKCPCLGQGGVAIAAKKGWFSEFLEVSTSINKNITVGRLKIGSHTLRIILGYAPQETADEELCEDFFTDLAIEVQTAVSNNETPVLLGDMNAKIEAEESNPAIIQPKSRNGRIMVDLLTDTCNLKVVNSSKKCSGKWTHVVRTSLASSVLDYVMVTDMSIIKEMTIDEGETMCPFYVVSKKPLTYQRSDHNAIVIELTMSYNKEIKKKQEKEEFKGWKITEEGLAQIEEAATDIMDTIESNNEQQEEDTQAKYNQIENKIKRVMETCFSHKRSKKKAEVFSPKYVEIAKRINELSRQGKHQRKIAQIYRQKIMKLNEEAVSERQTEAMKKILEEMTTNGKFTANGYWKLRRATKSKTPDCTSVYNTEGNEVFGKEGIKMAFEEEFKKRLSPREMETGYENIKERTELLCKMVLDRCSKSKENPFTPEEYSQVKKRLKKRKAAGLDFIPAEVYMNGGEVLDREILEIFNVIKESLETPDQWNEVGISPIYKNKGSKKDLVNQRGLFLTLVISKIFERMVMGRIKGTTKNINLLQAGGTRSTYDQTFILRGLIAHAKYIGITLFLTLYDFKQCFDNLWLEDSILSLWKLGLETDMLPLIYKMNETSKITVKTPVGNTDSFDIPLVCKQGTVLTPPLCSASVAESCSEHTSGGASIGQLRIQSLAFMDDLMDTNTTVADVQTAHEETKFFSKKKKMPLNEDKCIVLAVNSRHPHPMPVLSINNKKLKIKDKAKYLGDIFNQKGDNQDLIKDRKVSAIRCLISCITECYTISRGAKAMNTLLMLYHTVYLPTIIHNSESWDNLTKNDINQLEVLQMKFLKRMVETPKSTPNVVTLLELGVLPIETAIRSRQLNYLHSILTREDRDPVKRTYKELKKFTAQQDWAKEIEETRVRFGISLRDEEIEGMAQGEWKSLVKRQLKVTALNELLQKRQKKGSSIEYGKLMTRNYFDKLPTQDAKLYFKLRAEVYDLKAFREYKYDDTLCRLCSKETENLEHIINDCPEVPRASSEINVCTEDIEDIKTIIGRVRFFEDMINLS